MHRTLSKTSAALLFSLALAAGAALAATPRLTEPLRQKIAPATLEAYDAGQESFRVIVHLEAPPAAHLPMSPRGVEIPRARLEAVRETLDRELRRIRRETPGGRVEVRHAFRLQPAFSATVDREALAALAARPEVRWVEHEELWHAMTAEGIPLIHADVLQSEGYDGTGTSVAIIDTGIDPTHPALGGGPIPNGKIVYGKDTADINDQDGPIDCGTHGTAVASIAAGLPYQWDTGQSFAGGVAPGASILAYKASPSDQCGSFFSGDVVEAIEDAILHRDQYNVAAINLSIGGGSFDGPCDSRNSSYATAIDDATQAGIAVFVAAGNENNKGALDAPACVSNAVSVGSVYDSSFTVFPPGIQYCGNDSCTEILCTDENPISVKTVTCYSNSDEYLDLLAPSELLTAALAHGTVGDFGGTSGATPYATGSAALIHQALPSLDPTQIRLLLGMSGEMITDDANGVTRPMLDLTAALDDAGANVGLGTPSNVAIPNATGSPAVSTALVSTGGTVHGVRVALKIKHADPEQLLVTLVSPSGTRVVLHDHGPGMTPGGSTDDIFGVNGIYAYYPQDRQPVQSLDAFTGEIANGTWRLEVLDDDPSTNGSSSQLIVGWALEIDTGQQAGPPTLTSYSIPVAAHLGGFQPTFWKSDLRIFNPDTSQPVSFDLYAIPEGQDGTQNYFQTRITVQPNAILSLPDVLKENFGLSSDKGQLIVQADGTSLLLTSRTYNTGGAAGTYGQFVGAVRGIEGIGRGDTPLTMLQLSSGANFHTNVGISEVAGASAQVEVTLYDGDTGQIVGDTRTYTIEPFSNLQTDKVFQQFGAGDVDNGYAIVQVVGGNGRIVAYATAVDDASGDATYVPGTRPQAVSGLTVPVVASGLGGSHNTHWTSDLRLFNGGGSTVQVELTFRPEITSGGSTVTVTKSVAPGRVLPLDEIVTDTFGQTGTKGSLTITPEGGSATILATSRTYTTGSGAGTYGQFVPAVASGFGSGSHATVLHMDKDADFRSNIGICEVSGGTVTVRYALKNASGTTLGTKTIQLGPHELLQVDDIFADLGVAPEDNTRVDFFLDAGTGSFTAYGTLVDNTSGDAIYIPAAAY